MAPDGLSNGNGVNGTASGNGGSNIRVFVRWHDQTVFAGEEVKCTITFRNVARPAASSQAHLSPQHSRNSLAERTLSRQSSSSSSRGPKTNAGLAPPPAHRGHRSSLSLTVPSAAAASRARAGSIPWSPHATDSSGSRPPPSRSNGNGHGHGHGHKRSLSIVSIGSAGTAEDNHSVGSSAKSSSSRPARGHARASSLQIMPRGGLLNNGPRSASHPQRPYSSQTSPLFNASYPPPDRNTFNGRPSGAATAPNTPRIGISRASSRSSEAMPEFRFPMTQSPTLDSTGGSSRPGDDPMSPTSMGDGTNNNINAIPTRLKDSVPMISEHGVAPAARILSTTSIAGTPRSSGEFYSLSNNSSETLASEYVTQQPVRSHGRPSSHLRRMSNLSSGASARAPEVLMMGYAQVHGSFTLDGSLVNLGPFEAVKRKAVVGGQGGGVIGVETSSKRESGLLKSFGWGNFTNSIGELLGGGELSSIKEMRGIASSKSIPLLSTPQSILFVDLQLGPGESKSYEYAFTLPKGLPPTHRGKAMKISYNIVIGTQRPGGAKEQQVKSVEVPFRVLGSVNSHGEILGHDLMVPYIQLRDQARVQALEKGHHHHHHHHQSKPTNPHQPPPSLNSFLTYVDELLSHPRNGLSGGGGLLSPTAMPNSRRLSTFEDGFHERTAKEAIDLAILRANLTSAGQQSANRFEIARNGRRVGVVMLARPAYRLGESVSAAVDFTGAEIPCYAVHAALETAETVDQALALRSEASVHRVTRKVHVAASEAALFARRVVFTPTIPVSATPEFVTSGVSLEWKIRLEFVVPAQADDGGTAGSTARNSRASSRTRSGAGEDGAGRESPRGRLLGDAHAYGEYFGDGTDESDASSYRDGSGSARVPHHGQHGQQHQQRRKPRSGHPLLEPVSRDDRGGLVMVALEDLVCESFEVAVPLRVYGAVCNGLERLERDEALEEGLAV